MSTLWTVSEWADSLTERTEAEARKPNYVMKSLPFYAHVFETEAEAKRFIIERAGQKVQTLRAELAKAEKRFRKCKNKFIELAGTDV